MKITELFERGEFVVSAEVGPPKGINIDHLLEEAKEYLSNITAVNVTDNQSSVMRMGSLGVCKALKDVGLNPIFQMTCRDRNRLALQSDLLTAAMFGIDNILWAIIPRPSPCSTWTPSPCCTPCVSWSRARIWPATTW